MRDFIYNIFAPTLGLFYLPYYPATISLFLYVCYALVKGRAVSKWVILCLSLLTFLPTLLMILFAVLEVGFVGGYRYGVVFFYAGIGIVTNVISCILLVVYMSKHRAKMGRK
jgi:hypothetical protein